jgi:PAS domain S-box-containing protein
MSLPTRGDSALADLRRWALAAIIALAVLLAMGIAGSFAARRETGQQIAALKSTIELQRLGLASAVTRFQHVPYTVAQHPEVMAVLHNPADQDLIKILNAHLKGVNDRVGAEALYLIDTHGATLAASNASEPYTVVADNNSYRLVYKNPQGGPEVRISDEMNERGGIFFAMGGNTGVPGLFIITPVLESGRWMGVLAIKVSLQNIERAWRLAADPISLVDKNGIVFLSSISPWLYTATRVLSPSEKAFINETSQFGKDKEFEPTPWQSNPAGGESGLETIADIEEKPRRFLTLTEELSELQWKLVVMTSLEPVEFARHMAWALSGLLCAVLLLVTKLWQLRARRYAEQLMVRIELERQVLARTAELRESHAFRKAMGDSLLVGLRASALDGTMTFVNPAMCDISGYRAEELISTRPPYPYWHPDDMDKHWQDSKAVLSGQAALTGFESCIRHRDGHDVHTMVYTAPLIGADGAHNGWISSVVDITAQKLAEEAQRVQAAKMQRASRMASMGEMASTLAHELSQPLMALVSFAGAASAYTGRGDQDQALQALSEINEQAQRAADIVKRIRGFVKQHTPGFQGCTVNDVVNNVVALLRPEIRHQQAQVLTQLSLFPPVIQADRLLLEQVLLNLIVNALQAMHDVPAGQKVIQVETGEENDRVFIRVSDRGPGIAAELGEQLFQPFFTTKPDGLGLGLNICRTTVESHRGRLLFDNRSGGGAVFTVYLPLKP